MHELGVVFHVLDDVIAIAKDNQASCVDAVVLEIGTVSGIVDDYLLDCWNWAIKKHEETTNCELKIEHIEAISYCEDCGENFDTISNGKICPKCGSDKTFLLQGNEFIIKEIQVT